MSASVGVLSSKTYFRSTENLLISNLACHILSYRVVLWFLCYVWHRLAQGDQQQVGSSTLGHRYVSSFPGETGMIYDAHWCSCCRYLRLWDCQDTCLSAFSFCSQDNLQGSGLLGTSTQEEWHKWILNDTQIHTNIEENCVENCLERFRMLSALWWAARQWRFPPSWTAVIPGRSWWLTQLNTLERFYFSMDALYMFVICL